MKLYSMHYVFFEMTGVLSSVTGAGTGVGVQLEE